MSESTMRLAQVIERLDDYDDDLTIWARARDRAELTPDTEAVVAPELEDGGVWWEERGLLYVLEVDLAKDAIRVWRQDHDGVEPSVAQRFSTTPSTTPSWRRTTGRPMGPGLKRDVCEGNMSCGRA